MANIYWAFALCASSALITLYELAHPTLITTVWGRCYNYPHFTDDKIAISFKEQVLPVGVGGSPKYLGTSFIEEEEE